MSKIAEFIEGFRNRTERGPVKIVVAFAAVAAIALALFVSARVLRSPSVPVGEAPLTCQNCGHQWQAALDTAPRCPECGTTGGVIPTWYRCPSCPHEFLGSEVKMVGPGEYRFRVAGTEKWLTYTPHRIVCPRCKRPLPDLQAAMLRGSSRQSGGTRSAPGTGQRSFE